MTKLVCSPGKFLDIIRKGLINNHFEAMDVEFAPTGVTTTTSRAGTFGSHNTYKPAYFKEYVCQATESVKLTKELFENMQKLKFGEEQEITVETDLVNSRLNIAGVKRDYHPVLTNPEVQPLKMTIAEKPTIGWLPAKEDRPIHYQIRVPASDLATPKVDKVTYKTGGATLILDLNLGGAYNEKITPTEVIKPRNAAQGEKTDYTFFVDHLTDILANFSDLVVVTIYEKGIFITQLNDNYSLMYMTAVT
jgi:hypothetical protein